MKNKQMRLMITVKQEEYCTATTFVTDTGDRLGLGLGLGSRVAGQNKFRVVQRRVEGGEELPAGQTRKGCGRALAQQMSPFPLATGTPCGVTIFRRILR